jgi:hypothetical protein
MHATLPIATADTAEALLSLFASEFPEGSKPSLLPKYDDQFRARIEAPAGPVTILIPRRTLAAFASSQFDHEAVLMRLRRFIRERLSASHLRPDVVTVWDYAEAF